MHTNILSTLLPPHVGIQYIQYACFALKKNIFKSQKNPKANTITNKTTVTTMSEKREREREAEEKQNPHENECIALDIELELQVSVYCYLLSSYRMIK